MPRAVSQEPRAASYTLALSVGVALVLFRAFVWVWYPHADFDSDQGIVGLMGKHLAEGRAFPLFFYGQPYLLGVEAWVAAPIFLVAGASLFTLKVTILALNLLVALLLVRELVRTTGLAPWAAVACSLFVLLPPPITSAMMLRAVGMNIEPFLAVLLLWLTRRRPAWFGLVLGLGFLNREFTIYGLTALIVVEVLDRSLLTRAGLAARAASLLVFAAVWDVVRLLTPYSSTHGPASPPGLLDASSGSLATVWSFATFSATRLWSDVRLLLSGPLPELLNARPMDVASATGPVASSQGAAWLGAVLLGALGVPFLIVLVRLTLRPRDPLAAPARFPLFLALVGAQSALVYAFARGAAMSIHTQRYMLLALFLPVGVSALVMRTAAPRGLRVLCAAGLLVWGAVTAGDTARLASRFVAAPPPDRRAALVDSLLLRGVRFGTADYWDAYAVTFAGRERVRLGSGITRIVEYERLVAAHRDEAISLKRRRCDGCEQVEGWWITEKGKPWQ